MSFKFAAVVAIAGALAVACSAGPDATSNSRGPDGSAELQDSTYVVSQELSEVATVFADHLEFPATVAAELMQRPAGSVLVGDRAIHSAGNPEGFLRKVVSVSQSGDKVIVQTKQATLLDATKSVQFQGSFQTPALSNSGTMAARGAKLQGTGKTVSLVDFSNTTVFDKTLNVTVASGKTVGAEVFLKVNKGTLDFTPKWDVGADASLLGGVKSLHATATGDLAADLEVDAGVKLQTNLDNDTFTQLVAQKLLQASDATIADYTVNLGSMHVGPLPLPVNAHFTAKLSCELEWSGGAEVVVGGTANGSITAGLKYENGAISPVFDKSVSFAQIGPNWTLDGVTRVSCSIHPEFELHLFDVAMAQVWADGYVDLGGDLACAGKDGAGNLQGQFNGLADVGASAGVHAKVDVFGLYKWEKECTLFDVNASTMGSTTFVLPGGGASTATCNPTNVYDLSPKTPANPASCWGSDSSGGDDAGVPPVDTDGGSASDGGADGGDGSIPGTCTHDVCTAGDALGQDCNSCTQAVCAADPYCCDTFWGPSCFADVQKYCGMTCP